MQIAIFGGSFDPVHLAHVAIVEKALKELDIDKLLVVPTYLNPFKSSFHLGPKTRFQLLKKVFKRFNKVEVCDYEINQKKLSYSFDTVSYIRNLYKPSKIYFILGEDNIRNLNNWHKFEELQKMVEFIVATRNGFESDETKHFKKLDIRIKISSSSLRENIDINFIPIEIKDDILNLKKGKSF